MKRTLFLVFFLPVFAIANGMSGGAQVMSGVQAGLSGANAALNASEGVKNHKACKGGDKSACIRAVAHFGQMLQSLTQMAGSLMTQVSATPDSGGSGKIGNFEPGDYERFSLAEEQPLEYFSNEQQAEEIFDNVRTPNGEPLTAQERRDIVQAANYAADAQVDLDKATGKITSDQGVMSLASLSTPEGMKSLGFSQDDITGLLKKQNALASKFGNVFKDGGSGTGGGGKPAPPNFDGSEFDFNFNPTTGADGGLKSVLGDRSDRVWSRDFGGTPIGIKQGNIFKMINSRYRKKIAEIDFLP